MSNFFKSLLDHINPLEHSNPEAEISPAVKAMVEDINRTSAQLEAPGHIMKLLETHGQLLSTAEKSLLEKTIFQQPWSSLSHNNLAMEDLKKLDTDFIQLGEFCEDAKIAQLVPSEIGSFWVKEALEKNMTSNSWEALQTLYTTWPLSTPENFKIALFTAFRHLSSSDQEQLLHNHDFSEFLRRAGIDSRFLVIVKGLEEELTEAA